MEITDPLNIDDQLITASTARNPKGRLNLLVAANAEIIRRKQLFPTRHIELEVNSMSNPLDFRRVYSYLGLMLGLFPPASFFLLFLVPKGGPRDNGWIIWLLLWVNLVTTVAGYFSGKVVGAILSNLGKRSFRFFAFLAPLIGFLWGGVTGATGGVFIFVIGAFFGAVIGGIVGAVALPAFLLIHHLVKRGDMIELKHFLPIASGVTFSICAYILRFLH